MHAVDHGVNRDDLEAVPLRFDDRRIVTDTDSQPGWSRRELPLNARDQFALREFGYCHFA
jgi:hypothetical protein